MLFFRDGHNSVSQGNSVDTHQPHFFTSLNDSTSRSFPLSNSPTRKAPRFIERRWTVVARGLSTQARPMRQLLTSAWAAGPARFPCLKGVLDARERLALLPQPLCQLVVLRLRRGRYLAERSSRDFSFLTSTAIPSQPRVSASTSPSWHHTTGGESQGRSSRCSAPRGRRQRGAGAARRWRPTGQTAVGRAVQAGAKVVIHCNGAPADVSCPPRGWSPGSALSDAPCWRPA